MKIKKSAISVIFLALIVFLTGCAKSEQKQAIPEAVQPVASQTLQEPVSETQPVAQNEQQEFIDNRFVSRDNSLSFTFKEGWVCREVAYGARVDCYPEARREEEYDAGLDQPIVYYPNISIWFKGCAVTDVPETDPDIQPIYFYFKKFGDCTVRVVAADADLDTEAKLDAIIWDFR